MLEKECSYIVYNNFKLLVTKEIPTNVNDFWVKLFEAQSKAK
jgi:hypothetical protein